jgi:hypothetical protein
MPSSPDPLWPSPRTSNTNRAVEMFLLDTARQGEHPLAQVFAQGEAIRGGVSPDQRPPRWARTSDTLDCTRRGCCCGKGRSEGGSVRHAWYDGREAVQRTCRAGRTLPTLTPQETSAHSVDRYGGSFVQTVSRSVSRYLSVSRVVPNLSRRHAVLS